MNKPQCDYSLTDASLRFLSYPRDFLEKNVRPVLICASQTCPGWAHSAPMDTHDSATKTTPQLMALRHGALSGFCSISILMKRLNAF